MKKTSAPIKGDSVRNKILALSELTSLTVDSDNRTPIR